MRSLTLSFGRCLVMLLVLEFADVPITCADEWSSKGTTSESGQAFDSPSLTADSAILSSQAPSSENGGDMSCYCPCHLTFQSSSDYWVPPPSESIVLGVLPSFSRVPLISRSLEHPPQN